MRTRVIHVSEMGDNFDAEYVGRKFRNRNHNLAESDWANPFNLKYYTREESLRRYIDHAESKGLIARVDELQGRPLACWCHRSDQTVTSNNLCHADLIAAVANSGRDDWQAARSLLVSIYES